MQLSKSGKGNFCIEVCIGRYRGADELRGVRWSVLSAIVVRADEGLERSQALEFSRGVSL
jgi:hypothetical protein